MRHGVFYGVSVGPGDPELLTLKAVRVLERCPVLAVPQTRSGEMVAYTIVAQAVQLEDKLLLPLQFSMSPDRQVQRRGHLAAVEQVRAHLLEGRDVAMPVLGDVSVFSTYCYLMDLLKEEGFRCEMIPGVTSFCAAAARLGRSLTTEPDRPLHIIPGGGAEALDLPGGKVIMKAGRQLPQLLEQLEERDLLARSGMVENCGLPGERVVEHLDEKPRDAGYFTTLIVP